jgi:hypothetical protein
MSAAMAMTANPPTTPPTMAPMGVFLPGGLGVGDGEGDVGVEKMDVVIEEVGSEVVVA